MITNRKSNRNETQKNDNKNIKRRPEKAYKIPSPIYVIYIFCDYTAQLRHSQHAHSFLCTHVRTHIFRVAKFPTGAEIRPVKNGARIPPAGIMGRGPET